MNSSFRRHRIGCNNYFLQHGYSTVLENLISVFCNSTVLEISISVFCNSPVLENTISCNQTRWRDNNGARFGAENGQNPKDVMNFQENVM